MINYSEIEILSKMNVRNVCVLFYFENSIYTNVKFFDLLRMNLSSNISDLRLIQAIEAALEEKNFAGAISRTHVENCNRTIVSEIFPPCNIDAYVTLYVIEKDK